MVDADQCFAGAVEFADDGDVARFAEFDDLVFWVDLMVVVAVEDPLTAAVDADFFDAVAGPVADDGNVALLAEFTLEVFVGETSIAVGVASRGVSCAKARKPSSVSIFPHAR